jgi:hypothetical protein
MHNRQDPDDIAVDAVDHTVRTHDDLSALATYVSGDDATTEGKLFEAASGLHDSGCHSLSVPR